MNPSARPESRLERAAYLSMLAFAATPQFSIAAAGILLTLTTMLWLAVVVAHRERVEVPGMFWPLAAYAGATLAASYFSIDPATSFRDSKQLVLLLIVPIAYRLLRGPRGLTAVDVIITVGAFHAVYGVVQFAVLHQESEANLLENRVQGVLGHYMTYSGVIMLVTCTAAARIMFRRQDRMWAALVMPALVVALVLTLSRNAWVGACAGIATLFLLRDFRLLGLLPVLLALFVALAPAPLAERFYAMFSVDPLALQDETSGATVQSNRDRLAMIRSGFRMIQDHPLTGVGPEMVMVVYPQYRDPLAVRQLNPHLHNVPLQIAAERGLPALAIWLWFVIVLARDLLRARKTTVMPSLATGALACLAAMLAAGMFEYNFGDSEFLMLFLVLVTLPCAADRVLAPAAAPQPAG